MPPACATWSLPAAPRRRLSATETDSLRPTFRWRTACPVFSDDFGGATADLKSREPAQDFLTACDRHHSIPPHATLKLACPIRRI